MKPDTPEARRLAGLLDTDHHEPLVEQAAAAMLRALADEIERLTSAITKYEADDVRYMAERKRLREALERIAGFDPYNSDGMRTIAREALK